MTSSKRGSSRWNTQSNSNGVGGATQRDSKQNKNTLTLGVDHKLSYFFWPNTRCGHWRTVPCSPSTTSSQSHADCHWSKSPKSKMFKNQNTRNKAANSRCLWTGIFYRFLIVIALHFRHWIESNGIGYSIFHETAPSQSYMGCCHDVDRDQTIWTISQNTADTLR